MGRTIERKQSRSIFRFLSGVLPVLLFCVLTATVMTGANIPAFAEDVWNGSLIAAAFPDGDGTLTTPYKISTGAELALLAQKINTGDPEYNGADVFYVLTDDIYLNDSAIRADLNGSTPNEWIPIGTADNQFAASFDGAGYKVYGLFISADDEDYQGLFGYIGSGSVSSLAIEESLVKGKDYVGGIAGIVGTGKITDCYNDGEVIGNNYVGGIAGERRSGSIFSCFNTGDVSGSSYAGGIAGRSFQSGNTVRIEHCYNTGAILGGSNIGGILGGCDMIAHLVYNCYNGGEIVASGDFAGGIIGKISVSSGTGVVTNCYNYGQVSSANYAGGIAGGIGSGYGTLTNCFNTGAVAVTGNGSTYCGSVTGYAASRTALKNCYWLESSANAACPDSPSSSAYVFAFDTGGNFVNQGNYGGYTTLAMSLNYWVINNQPSGAPFLYFQEVDSAALPAEFSDKKYFTVVFNMNGATGTPPLAQFILQNGFAAEPAAIPVRSGYKFIGWYKDSGGTEKWKFDSDTVVGDTTLYAGWADTVSITTSALAGGIVNSDYSAAVSSSYGGLAAGITYEIVSGSLPGGLGLNTVNGQITGKPAAIGSFTFVIKATHTASGDSDQKQFTIVISKETGTGSVAMADWVYNETASVPVPSSSTNGVAGVTYEYKPQSASDSSYVSEKPSNAGNYTVRATFPETAGYKGFSVTANFTVLKAAGTGSVTMSGWTYGEAASEPVPVSETNGIDGITIEYKLKDARDDTYVTTKPTNAGNYTVRITFAASANYDIVSATADFTVAPAPIGGNTGGGCRSVVLGDISAGMFLLLLVTAFCLRKKGRSSGFRAG